MALFINPVALLVVAAAAGAGAGAGAEAGALHPIVLVPGLAGSRFRALLNGTQEPHFYCSKHDSWYDIWVSAEELVPGNKDCLMHNLELHYDAASGLYSNTSGVELDTNVDFGNLTGVQYLDPSLKSESGYYAKMISSLQANFGYVAGVNLHGAGYDWRLAADGLARPGGYYDKLETLIKQTFAANNNSRVHLISHSLGGPIILAFLNLKGAAWQQQYIQSFISLSGVFGGSTVMAKSLISGDTLGVPLVPSDYLRQVQSSAASGTYLLPLTACFSHTTIVATKGKNYTASDWLGMIHDLGLQQASDIFVAQVKKKMTMVDLQPPQIDAYVLTSLGVKTANLFIYKESFSPGYSKDADRVEYGDGDGTVNLQSLLWPQHTWKRSGAGAAKLEFLSNFSGVSHFGMVSDAGVLSNVNSIIKSYS